MTFSPRITPLPRFRLADEGEDLPATVALPPLLALHGDRDRRAAAAERGPEEGTDPTQHGRVQARTRTSSSTAASQGVLLGTSPPQFYHFLTAIYRAPLSHI
jgi:hypothetical protein